VPELSSYDATSPLLLVTAFAAGNRGGGAVILRSLLKGAEARVLWVSLAPDERGYAGPTAQLRTAPANPWLVPPGLLAARIEALADRHGASAVWAVAHGPVVPCLAEVASKSSRRLHVSVHDDPAWAAAFRGRRELALVPWLHTRFGRALDRAASLDAICGGMRAAIAHRAGRDSIIVHRVLDEPVAENDVPQDGSRLTVGLLGSVYAQRQLEQLTGMLARAATLIGVPTRLVIIGGIGPGMRRAVAGSDIEIEFLGHLGEPEGVQMLREAFALYVGYPFDRRNAALRRTSFPAKLATYTQAARPVIVHSPYDSSLAPLFGLQPFCIPWVDENIDRGARLLASAWRQRPLRESQHEPAEALRRIYFGADNRDRLFEALNALV